MTDELVRVDEDRGICRIVMTAGANPLNLGLMEALRSAVAVLPWVVRNDVTVGEMMAALAEVFGKYKGPVGW